MSVFQKIWNLTGWSIIGFFVASSSILKNQLIVLKNIPNSEATLFDASELPDDRLYMAAGSQFTITSIRAVSLDSLEGRPNLLFQEWIKHPAYDNYWKRMTPTDGDYANLNIPVLTIAGYYDVDQSGALYYFRKHLQQNPNTNHYLILGPYDHIGLQGRIMPDLKGYRLDSAAIIKIYALTFSWFDYILKGAAKPTLLKDKINYEVMDANRWEHAPSLESLQRKKMIFYLGSKEINNRYPLDQSPAEGTKGIIMDINFLDRKDTISAIPDYGIVDTALHIPKDMMVFESAPFSKATVMAGTLSGDLQVIINKKDVDLIIQLSEQMADGKYLQLNDDLLRASYAKDRSERHLLHPGRIEHIPLVEKTFFISREIAKNSKVVLVLGVNHSAGYEVNYGSGKKVSSETISDGLKDLVIQFMPQSFINILVK